MECACPVLDMILIYLVLHVKDMSFDKQNASDVTDQQHKTRHRFTTTPFHKKQLWFVIILGFCYQERTVTKQTSTSL